MGISTCEYCSLVERYKGCSAVVDGGGVSDGGSYRRRGWRLMVGMLRVGAVLLPLEQRAPSLGTMIPLPRTMEPPSPVGTMESVTSNNDDSGVVVT
jgi:hypothetical protein